jgi:hypothetical protein
MQSQEADFCELNDVKTLVMTWNAGASTPYHLQHSEQDQRFFKDLLESSDSPDILVFAFQELVDLEDKKTTASRYESVTIRTLLISHQRVFSNQRRRTPQKVMSI